MGNIMVRQLPVMPPRRTLILMLLTLDTKWQARLKTTQSSPPHTRLTALCLDRAGVAKYYRIAWWTATNTSASCYVEILWVRVIFSGCFRCPRYLPVFTSGYVSTGHLTWVWIWRVWHVNKNCKIIIKMPITATERENMHFATCV